MAATTLATAANASATVPGAIEQSAGSSTSTDDSLAPARRINHSGNDAGSDAGSDDVGPLPIAGIGEAAATLLPVSRRPSGLENASVRGSVVISEVLFNPSAVYDSRGEWFEVVNTTNATIDLSGWTFGDEVYDIHTISDLQIAPGGRAVLARVADSARNGGVEVDYEFGDAVLLYNRGDRIVIRDGAGSISDVVNYGESSFVRPEGRSISYEADSDRASEVANDDGTNWCLATTPMPAGDLASPGAPNQCDDSDASLVITEVMNNPAATSDTVGEWFELRNTGADVDLAGFSVQDDDGEKFTVDSTLKVAAGASVVFARNGDPAVNGGVVADFDYTSKMSLHNTFDELVVTDDRGIQVDAVRWDDGRTFPDPNGASMQLAAVAADNADGANWCLSARRWATGDLGTPGAVGDCDIAEVPLIVITEVMSDPELTPSERSGEWFEIANLGSAPAVLDGFSLRTRSQQHIVSELTVPAGERAVLGVYADPAVNGGVPVDYAYGEDLSLFNAAGVIEIVTPNNISVDRVEYSAASGFPLDKAHSIELGSTATDNALGANWCSTIDRYNDQDFGTPGAAGTCDEPAPIVALQISEVTRNPAVVSDRDGEWFEVFNPTADDIDLLNWSIGDEGSEHYVVRQSVIVPAEGYAVVARSGDQSINGGVSADLVIGDAMVLYNSADEIVIHDQHGRGVDAVRWTSSGLMPRPNGGSMSRTDASLKSFAPSDDPSEWCTTSDQFGAGDTGTPRAANTCTAQPNNAIVINEIHRDPQAEPDAQGEWIELHNRGDQAIDIGGWTLRDDDVDTFVFPPDTVIDGGGHLTAGRNDATLNGGIDMDLLYGIEIINFNTTDELMLFDADLTIVDRVAWNAENGFPKVPGATMSLRDPLIDNAVGANWCAAVTDQGNGDLGTPGAANLCEIPVEPDPTQPTVITHSIFATGDGKCGGDVDLQASTFDVGAVRANDDLTAKTSIGRFRGAVTYGDKVSAAGIVSRSEQPVRSAPYEAVPFGWSIGDFAPGGVRAVAAGDQYHVHDGGLKISGNGVSLPAGIHYVTGDVKFSGSSILLNEVTIVATGEIQMSGSQISLSSFGGELPALMTSYDKCSKDGVKLSTSVLSVTGAVYAPDSQVSVNSSIVEIEKSSFVGSDVTVKASRATLNPLVRRGR
ncbi:MAG: lamin tail domain-containing protein [Ilumatobacter sp.]|uniref:lamin tail domain-containing protein n=1 Tax=Ilumatobacter sp. TaxID=1967498 RepID=UPI003C7314CF